MKYLPPFKIRVSEGQDGPCHELVSGKHFHFGLSAVGSQFWANPPPRLLDLLRVATSIYVVDRLAKRKRRCQQCRWFRSLKVSVAVSQPDFWQSQDVLGTLMECLDFLSEDNWELTFVKDDPPPVERFLPGENPFLTNPPLVCLNSGGLDSAAGLAIRMAENPKRPVLPVTVRHQPNQKAAVQRQCNLLGKHFGVDIHPLFFKAAMLWTADLKRRKQEFSQRCRSILFAAVGGVVAAMSEVAAVEVFESGIGAINLPLLAGMVGSRATRGSHPCFFRLMSKLVSLAAGREIAFQLPFLEKTKGEVVTQLKALGLEDLARSTVSCVHYPLRERPHKQCGVCPACILRRQAMAVAGIEEPGVYKYDLLGPVEAADAIPEDRLIYLKAILLQVANMGPLDPGSRVPDRVRRHLLATNVASREEGMAPFLGLLSRYRHEWLDIVAQGMEEPGWAWTNLLAPVGAALMGEENHASA